VGTRKALALSRAGAEVTVIAPAITEELAAQIEPGRVRWLRQPFHQEHLAGAFLVVAATDDETLNEAIVRHAAELGALACDASSARRSGVIFGACHDAGDVTVAVLTDGRDPALASKTRDQIAAFLAAQDEPRRRS
jgi:uroporphyrin-III C-methyltransferase/precorrin-2 dehydrogenase/sirohydrochlorin ferrochelatase